ncbi:hypothetical protein [Frondihabitans sucicola]|nr:hypothetical protein [Frondihabitans sucicola]
MSANVEVLGEWTPIDANRLDDLDAVATWLLEAEWPAPQMPVASAEDEVLPVAPFTLPAPIMSAPVIDAPVEAVAPIQEAAEVSAEVVPPLAAPAMPQDAVELPLPAPAPQVQAPSATNTFLNMFGSPAAAAPTEEPLAARVSPSAQEAPNEAPAIAVDAAPAPVAEPLPAAYEPEIPTPSPIVPVPVSSVEPARVVAVEPESEPVSPVTESAPTPEPAPEREPAPEPEPLPAPEPIHDASAAPASILDFINLPRPATIPETIATTVDMTAPDDVAASDLSSPPEARPVEPAPAYVPLAPPVQADVIQPVTANTPESLPTSVATPGAEPDVTPVASTEFAAPEPNVASSLAPELPPVQAAPPSAHPPQWCPHSELKTSRSRPR